MTDPMRVSRQERLLYGEEAEIVRAVGDLVTAAEKARSVVEDVLSACREADDLEAQKTAPSLDEQGRSARTAWLEAVYDGIWNPVGALYELHRRTALEALSAEIHRRQGVVSQPNDVRVRPLTWTMFKNEYDSVRRAGGWRFVKLVYGKTPDGGMQGAVDQIVRLAANEGLRGFVSANYDPERGLPPGAWELVETDSVGR